MQAVRVTSRLVNRSLIYVYTQRCHVKNEDFALKERFPLFLLSVYLGQID